MCEDIDVCHKFVKEVASYVGKFSKRFVSIDYSVNDTVFEVKVSYCKDQFEHLIHDFVQEMFEELKKSKWFKCCWAVHCILCEEIETPEQHFSHTVKISVQRE